MLRWEAHLLHPQLFDELIELLQIPLLLHLVFPFLSVGLCGLPQFHLPRVPFLLLPVDFALVLDLTGFLCLSALLLDEVAGGEREEVDLLGVLVLYLVVLLFKAPLLHEIIVLEEFELLKYLARLYGSTVLINKFFPIFQLDFILHRLHFLHRFQKLVLVADLLLDEVQVLFLIVLRLWREEAELAAIAYVAHHVPQEWERDLALGRLRSVIRR